MVSMHADQDGAANRRESDRFLRSQVSWLRWLTLRLGRTAAHGHAIFSVDESRRNDSRKTRVPRTNLSVLQVPVERTKGAEIKPVSPLSQDNLARDEGTLDH